MSASYSPGTQGTSSYTTPGPVQERGGRRARRQYRNFLMNQLPGDQGYAPGGALGSIFQNLFGPGGEGSQDYLGARNALQNVLGGNLQGAYENAYNQLLPSTLTGIQRGQAGLQEAMGPQGLRFSTDLMGQQSGLAQNMLGDLSRQALGAAIPIFQGQTTGIGNLMQLLGNAQQTMSPIALLSRFLESFPPVGNKGTSSGGGQGASFGAGFM